MFQKAYRQRDEFRLFNVSGVDDFGLETEPSLFGFSCDETDGPVSVTFARGVEGVTIRLDTLRKLLDDAEADLLRRRKDWQEAFPDHLAP